MAKDAEGKYTIPVTYKYTPVAGESALSIEIAGNDNGDPIDDDVEVTLYTKFGAGNRTYSLEISNGARFWMDLVVKGQEPTSVSNEAINAMEITVVNGHIFVANATANVVIYDASGQLMRTVSAEVAAKGISMANGVYLVRVGDDVEKILVK